MQHVTVNIDDELMVDLDRIIASRGYQNRAELYPKADMDK